MEGAALIADALGRVRDMLHENIKDLTPQELVSGPKPHIGWFAWHLSRVQDSNIAPLSNLTDSRGALGQRHGR